MYKLPKKATVEENSNVDNPFIDFGTAYTYMTNEDTEWKISDLSINDTDSTPAKTLEPLYSNNSNIGYILYSDQGI